jgi:type II secretory pathway component PulM
MDTPAWRDRWDRLEARERRWLVVGTVVVVSALAYAFAWQPVVADLPRAGRDAERAQARWDRARAAVAIAGTRATVPAREPLDVAIRGALAKAGIAPADVTLDVSGPRAALTLPSIRFGTLVGLIDALARERAVHVVDATIVARVEPGRVRAELSLAR